MFGELDQKLGLLVVRKCWLTATELGICAWEEGEDSVERFACLRNVPS